MGAKQSRLKKEIEALKADAATAATTYKQDVETLRGEKRMLEFKLQALQEMAAKAQIEAETATQLAVENEEKMKALKWELVRRLSAPSNSISPTISVLTSSTSSSLSSASAIPHIPVSWKLKEGVTLRRSNTSVTNRRPKPDQNVSGLSEMAATQREGHASAIKPMSKSHIRDLSANPIARTPSNQIEVSEAKAPACADYDPQQLGDRPAADNFDKFAPVKRRSSTKESLSPLPEAQSKEAHRVESFSKGGKSTSSDCESEGRQAKSRTSSSEQEKIVVGEPRRSVLASTKGNSLRVGTSDDVLALSDDEED